MEDSQHIMSFYLFVLEHILMMVLFIAVELFTCRNTVTNSIDSVSYHRHPRAFMLHFQSQK